MPQVTLRYQRISDAQRFYEIMNNPNFIFFNAKPKSVEGEKKWLKQNSKRRKNNSEWNHTILYDNEIVGAIGIKINPYRKYIGEIGYFIDEAYWSKGIATEAVKLAEKECFNKLRLTRIEILMQPANKASEKVAIKCGYKKEGLLKRAVQSATGEKKDAFLYSKVI